MKQCPLLCCVSLLFLTMGCGGAGPTTYPVKGKVTINGAAPPANTQVVFSPVDPAIPVASGTLDASGNYSLYSGIEGKEGAVPGKYKVYFTLPVDSSAYMKAGKAAPKAADDSIPSELTNPSTTSIEKEVTAGENTINLEI